MRDPDGYKYALYDCPKCGRTVEWHDWKYTKCVQCHKDERDPLLELVKEVDAKNA